MDDDLDTPGALAAVFDLARRANAAADAGDADGAAGLAGTVGRPLRGARPAPAWPAPATRSTPRRPRLVAARDEARAARDWARADALRDELEARGWVVEDGPGGTRIRRR